MVTTTAVVEELDIPRTTLLRLAAAGLIPAYEVTKLHHRRRQWRFKVSEVRAALEHLPRPHSPS